MIPIEWNSKIEKSGAKAEVDDLCWFHKYGTNTPSGKTNIVCVCVKTLRPFLTLCQKYLTLLGSPETTSRIHVYMFISLSSELAVAASPLQYRLLKGQLHQRMSIEDLQVKANIIPLKYSIASRCVCTWCDRVYSILSQGQAPAIDWLGCLQAVFHPLSLSKDDHVVLHNLPYIVHMSQIITKWQNKHELSNRYHILS